MSELKITKKKKRSNTFQTYIHKILKKNQPEFQISSKASEQLNSFISTFCSTVSREARNACFLVGKSTVSWKYLLVALGLVLPSSEVVSLKNQQPEIIKKYTVFAEGEKPVRRESRAGLTVSVALCEKYLRYFDFSFKNTPRKKNQCKISVSKQTSIMLALVCEKILSEILELATIETKKYKKVIITPRHLHLAICGNDKMNHIKDACHIYFAGCGVVPHIKAEVLTTKRSKAVKNIKKYQKSCDLLVQKRPFDRAVISISKNVSILQTNPIRFKEGVFDCLQMLVEQKIVDLLKNAHDLAIHRNRDGVSGEDVDMAWKLTERDIPFTSECKYPDEEGKPLLQKEWGNDGIERLSFRAGIKRKRKSMYDSIRCFTQALLEVVLYKSLLYVSNRGASTMSFQDLKAAFESMGINFSVTRVTKPKKIKIPIE